MANDLHVVTTEGGDYHVGFDADGTFVPIGHVSAVRVRQLQERAANLSELAKDDSPEGKRRYDDAVGGLPYELPGKKSKGGDS